MKNKTPLYITIALIIVIALAGLLFLASKVYFPTPEKSGIKAVFLTNGQVYFGRYEGKSKEFLKLEDVYYFQGNSADAQAVANDSTTDSEEPTPQLSDLKLVRQGSEVHGPNSDMQIVIENILFIQDLRSDSRVVEAIRSSGN